MTNTNSDNEELERLRKELAQAQAEIRRLNEKIARAKDINPVKLW